MQIVNYGILNGFISSIIELSKPILIATAIFFPLEKIIPINKLKFFPTKANLIDISFYVAGAISAQIPFYLAIWIACKVLAITFGVKLSLLHGYGYILNFPLWLKIILLALVHDFTNYCLHFIFHKTKLWKIHVIHHSSKNINFLSLFRMHVIEMFIMHSTRMSLLFVLGFPLPLIVAYEIFYGFYGLLVHANLKISYGRLNYIFVSPIFHHWHHTIEKEGLDKNFSTVFSFWDYLFRTNYYPKELPKQYGVSTEIPEAFLSLLLHPFKYKKQT